MRTRARVDQHHRPKSKYRAVPTIVDGIRFHSKREAQRYAELKLLEKAGEIRDIELQPSFEIFAARTRFTRGTPPQVVATYRADFRYWDRESGRIITEDVKGVRTPLYKLKKKLVEIQYGIQIREV